MIINMKVARSAARRPRAARDADEILSFREFVRDLPADKDGLARAVIRARIEGGGYLRALRVAANLTQRDLASRLNISAAFLCHIEGGRMNLPSYLTRTLSAHLQVVNKREYGARILYAYSPVLFGVLDSIGIYTIQDVSAIHLPDFSYLDRRQALLRVDHRESMEVMGACLRLVRNELGKTQDAWAAEIGYVAGRTAVANIEAGVSRITYEYFAKWAAALGVSIESLAAFHLLFSDKDLFDLLFSAPQELLSTAEMKQVHRVAEKAARFFGQVKYEIGEPYQGKHDHDVRVDILFDIMGTRKYVCLHKKQHWASRADYWITDGADRIVCEKTKSIEDMVKKL
jgi:transcriptional regulator with XRE-family HTH domain